MVAMSKAKKSAAAKKAAKKRTRNAGARKATLSKKESEQEAVKYLKKSKPNALFLWDDGIPDIIVIDKGKLEFYEVKPYEKLWEDGIVEHTVSDDDKLLRPSQKREFPKIIKKKIPLSMLYYTRIRKKRNKDGKSQFSWEWHEKRLKKITRRGPDPEKLL